MFGSQEWPVFKNWDMRGTLNMVLPGSSPVTSTILVQAKYEHAN